MAKYRAFIIASGAFFALARAAGAADLLPPPPALEPLPPAPIEFSGWYLRGDVGLGANLNTPSLAATPNPIAGLTGATDNFYNPTISTSGVFDFGFGYQFNNWFRADVTEELRGGSEFQALEVVNYPPTAQYADFYRANLWSAVTMLNGYVDLGTWGGVTPYVGGGIGAAYNKISGFTDTGYAYNSGNAGQASWPSGGYLDDGGKWNFAWALMTGLSFDVSQNLKLDIGYRYLDYGKFATGTSHCLAAGTASGFDNTNCAGGYSIHSTNELASSDFRIGLRWLIGEATPAPVAPLVRKY